MGKQMAKKITSFGQLRMELQKKMHKAMERAIDWSFQDLQENVGHFYDSPEGEYRRTGQLKASPQIDAVNYNANSAIGQISINTSTQYYPAGRDTETIYGYAEDGRLLGNGGFWEKTEGEIQRNLDQSFGMEFSHK